LPRHNIVHVAVAIVVNAHGEVLISRRQAGTHLAGLWEFPGGKVEPGETNQQALKREISEEIGISIDSARPLIKVCHHYPEKSVLLDTWLVEQWEGEAAGCEGQGIQWVQPKEFSKFEFPDADQAILKAINLPSLYQINPEPGNDMELFLNKVESSLKSGVKLFQLRAKKATRSQLREISSSLCFLCEKYQARWLINGEPDYVFEFKAHGLHLTSQRLLTLSERPLGHEFMVGASCHNLAELEQARRVDVDFATLSPVMKTMSHPEQEPLGWESFQQLVDKINLPVYALGGMTLTDQKKAWSNGAQGTAMISGLWNYL
jgi:8-oxo-dGTP diphosphatase